MEITRNWCFWDMLPGSMRSRQDRKNVAGSLQSELTHGTLYKKVSSKYPLQYLFGGLYVSSVLLETITIVIVVIISKFVWGIEFSFHPAFLVPILLESLGMYGIGLIVAGIAIFFISDTDRASFCDGYRADQ